MILEALNPTLTGIHLQSDDDRYVAVNASRFIPIHAWDREEEWTN